MPVNFEIQTVDNLAEFVRRSAAYCNEMIRKVKPPKDDKIHEFVKIYQPIADALPNARRMAYDRTLHDLIAKTHDISTEKIIGQLENVSFPFSTMWLTGPNHIGMEDPCGALITVTDQEKKAFKILFVQQIGGDERESEIVEILGSTGHLVVNGKALGCGLNNSPIYE